MTRQPYLDPKEGEHLPKKEVSSHAHARLQVAAEAIAATKAVIQHQGNQVPALRATHLNSYARLQVMRDERCWEYANTETRRLVQENPEAATAAKAELAHGGNCGEHAWVAYHYLRLHAQGDRIQYSSVKDLDHAFVIMGDLAAERDNDLVVSDPWPNNPTACLWEDHFAFTADRTHIQDHRHMVADGKTFKDAIAHGLRLSAYGQQMVQQVATEQQTQDTVGDAHRHHFWNHNDSTAAGKKFEYTDRDRMDVDHSPAVTHAATDTADRMDLD